MKKASIINFLIENDLSDVEVLKEEKDALFVNFYFDFDKDIIDAAKAYADEESAADGDSKSWEKEYYFPYLYDFANDEVLSIIEDLTEDLDIAGEFVAFQIKDVKDEFVQFMALFTKEDLDINVEDYIREYINEQSK